MNDEAQAVVDYEQATAVAAEAIRREPGKASHYSTRGQAHCRLEEYEQAAADFTEYIRLEPEEPEEYRGRGIALQRMWQWVTALTDLSWALDLEPDSDWTLYNRALTHQVLKRNNESEADLNSAI